MHRREMGASPLIASIALQEALRTLGLGLELAMVRQAEIIIAADGIEVDVKGEYGRRTYAWEDLESQSHAQRRHRRPQPRPAPWMDPTALTRWSVLLRVIGQLLDAQQIRQAAMRVAVATPEAPDDCRVQVTAGDKVVVDEEQVRLHLLRLRTRRPAARSTDSTARGRPWWAIWRRG
jgi:hypothetical protein